MQIEAGLPLDIPDVPFRDFLMAAKDGAETAGPVENQGMIAALADAEAGLPQFSHDLAAFHLAPPPVIMPPADRKGKAIMKTGRRGNA
jgi:hypothetical protein